MIEFPFLSMRQWLSYLDEQKQLAHIKAEVDLKGELAALARHFNNIADAGDEAPALLFENIKGYPGWRIASSTFSSHKRMSLALDADPDNFL